MPKKNDTQAIQVPLTPEAHELIDLLKRTDAAHPKPEDVTALRKALHDLPDLWHNLGGNLSRLAIDQIIDKLTTQTTLREAVRQGATARRKGLGWAEADLLEKMLIENVVLMWVGFSDVQMRYLSAREGGSLSFDAGVYWEKRLTAAHKRYLKACESLARVRRMGKASAVQINIGDKQVNIAEGVPA